MEQVKATAYPMIPVREEPLSFRRLIIKYLKYVLFTGKYYYTIAVSMKWTSAIRERCNAAGPFTAHKRSISGTRVSSAGMNRIRRG